MTEMITIFNITVPAWLAGLAVLTVWVAGLSLAKSFFFHHLLRLAKTTGMALDDALVHSLRVPINLLIVGSGLIIAGRLMPLKPETDHLMGQGFKALLIVAVVWAMHRLVRELIVHYAARHEFIRAYRSLVQGLTQGAIIALGALILLDSFGISITPVLASLGIGSLAVALALQDTLANFFAGIHVVMDRPVQVGQFVKLESGEEGYVTHIGWRSTRIQMLPNNVVIVPNSKLASSVVTNYYYPDKELAVLVQIGVHYNSDLAQVERVTSAVAKEVQQQVPGGVTTFEPFIRYHTFADSSINFTVIMRAKEFVDQYLLKHEFIKRLHTRYQQEHIVIPFPIRTLDLTAEQLAALHQRT